MAQARSRGERGPAEALSAGLRRGIARLERRPAAVERLPGGVPPWRFGLDALDAALPGGGLAPDGLHEAAGRAGADGATAAVFLIALLRRLARRDGRDTVLVCHGRHASGRSGRPYGPGWHDLGLDPAHLLFLRAGRDRDILWAMEEGLRCGALAAVLAEVDGTDFTVSRRLSLAAREGLTPALLLRHDGLGPASAALTRWRVGALAGRADPFDAHAPGTPCWRLDLMRCRGGRTTCLDVEWNRETGDFGLAAALADRPAAPSASAFPRHARERKAG